MQVAWSHDILEIWKFADIGWMCENIATGTTDLREAIRLQQRSFFKHCSKGLSPPPPPLFEHLSYFAGVFFKTRFWALKMVVIMYLFHPQISPSMPQKSLFMQISCCYMTSRTHQIYNIFLNMGLTPPPLLNNVQKTALFSRDGFPYHNQNFFFLWGHFRKDMAWLAKNVRRKNRSRLRASSP